MNAFKPGQRWISNAEPELGIGRILKVQDRIVTINFDLVDEVRTYAMLDAPLTRVKFNVGDLIRARDQVELVVTQVIDRDGILAYQGEYLGTDTLIIETDLDANVTFSKPEERLFTQQIDDNEWFNLRYETLRHRARLAAMPVRGLLAPRVSLIPHQFYIAEEVASRYAPRVLLADEVGLGKTIEAGLIIHRQLTTGMANRVLVIVPPSLSFQWFVEMIRRFNLTFTLLDEDRCQQIEADNRPETPDDESGLDNPFDAQQLMLCSLSLFLDNPKRLEQAIECEWDLVVVDEAHHLTWEQEASIDEAQANAGSEEEVLDESTPSEFTPSEFTPGESTPGEFTPGESTPGEFTPSESTPGESTPGDDYRIVEALSRVASGLLLLTATPEQLGRLGHFSRLRLLDPVRYHDFDAFVAEESGYEDVANLIEALEQDPNTAIPLVREQLGQYAPERDEDLVSAMLDRHGTGRVLFRNVRESVAGFKRRQLNAHQLESNKFPMLNAATWNSRDPRLAWLLDLAAKDDEKLLVICALAETAIALEKYLREKTALRSTAFHEHMDLVARDRAASYFAEEDRGAKILVCSEIGSEGRNFQFAHHLVMFDLPKSPDLLEQRIGRLDRIGQANDVQIHVPFSPGSEQAKLLRIFNEGFGIFDKPNAAAQSVFDQLPDNVDEETLVQTAKKQSDLRLQLMGSGRDKLLELNSHRPEVSSRLIDQIQEHTTSVELEDYMEMSFSQFELESDPLSEEIMTVKPTDGTVRHDAVSVETQDRSRYPELPEEGLSYTFDRETALSREDVLFLTWEHPLVEQAMDLVASDVTGNNTVVVAKIQGIKTGTILIETLHVVEVVAPAELGAPGYLPPALVRSLITPNLTDVADQVPYSEWPEAIKVNRDAIGKIIASQEKGIRTMLSTANTCAQKRFDPIKAEALSQADRKLSEEIGRMKALSAINANVRPEELEFVTKRRDRLVQAISAAQIRLEAVRVIIAA